MSVVYITEQGAHISLKQGRLAVEKGPALLRTIRVDEVDQLVLMGAISLSAPVVHTLLKKDIDTVFLSMAGGFRGRLSPGFSKNVLLRCAQHRKLADEAFALDLARRFLRAKLFNQRRLLARAQRRAPEATLAQGLVKLRLMIEQLEKAPDLDVLRGYEGRAAADYFPCFGRLLKAPGIVFEKRMRRPPPDPVNVLLSFGYTMVGNLLHGLCEQAGFDPFLGALHSPEYGRPSLSLDLLEEMRPLLVDTVVVMVFNRREITPADFVHPEEDEEAEEEESWIQEGEEATSRRRVIFRKEGVLKWVTAMERRLNERVYYPLRNEQLTYRQVLREQVYLLARHIEGKGEYTGFEGPE